MVLRTSVNRDQICTSLFLTDPLWFLQRLWDNIGVFLSFLFLISTPYTKPASRKRIQTRIKITSAQNNEMIVSTSPLSCFTFLSLSLFFTHSLLFSCSYSLSLISLFLLFFPSLSSWANTKTEAPPLVVRPVPARGLSGAARFPLSDWIQLFTNKGTVNVFHNCKYESKDESKSNEKRRNEL